MCENSSPVPPVLDRRLAFRLPADIADAWRHAAAESGLSLSDWLRSQVKVDGVDPVITRKRTPVRPLPKHEYTMVDPALIRTLSLLGNNLNQIARSLNRLDAGQGYAHTDLLYLLTQIEARLTEIRDHAY